MVLKQNGRTGNRYARLECYPFGEIYILLFLSIYVVFPVCAAAFVFSQLDDLGAVGSLLVVCHLLRIAIFRAGQQERFFVLLRAGRAGYGAVVSGTYFLAGLAIGVGLNILVGPDRVAFGYLDGDLGQAGVAGHGFLVSRIDYGGDFHYYAVGCGCVFVRLSSAAGGQQSDHGCREKHLFHFRRIVFSRFLLGAKVSLSAE